MASMDDLLGSLDDQAEQKQQQADRAASSAQANDNTDKIVGAVDKSTQATTEGLKNVKGEVKVTNPTDVSGVVDSINKLNLTTFMQNEGLPQLAKNLSDLSGKTQDLQDKLENEGLKKMSDQLGQVVKKLDEVSRTLSKTEVSVNAKLQKTIDNLSKSINAIDFKPSVNVAAPQTKVVTTPVDLKPLLVALASVEQAVKDSETPETEIDLSAVTSGLSAVQTAITALRFPVPNYVLPFRSSQGKAAQVQLSSLGGVPVVNPDGTTISGGAGGGAATIADGADVAEGATTDVAVVGDVAGSLSAKLRGININTANIPAKGNNTAANSLPVTIATDITPPFRLSDGTNVAAVLAAGTPNASGNAQLTALSSWSPAAWSVTSVTAGTVYDVGNYKSVSVHITAQYTGTAPTITFQCSNDNVNWVSVALVLSTVVTGASPVVSTTTTGMYEGNLRGRYFRLNFTGAYTSGTSTGQIVFSPTATATLSSVGVNGTATVAGAKTNNNAAPAATNVGALVAVANAAPPALTETFQNALSVDLSGNLRTISASKNAAVAVSASVTVVKASAGFLSGVLVTAAGTTQALTIFDNASLGSGTVIGIVPSGATAGQYFPFNMPATAGITCSGSANNPAVTVAYS